MSNLYTEPTKDDLVYFAQHVVAALDEHVPEWRNTSPRCPTYTDCATDVIRQLALRRRPAVVVANVKRDSRVIAHMVECLSTPASQTPERADDQGPAHGLRQHSIGSTYPCVVVGTIVDGVTHYHVEFGGYRSIKMRSGALVQRWARVIAQRYRIQGWEFAVDYFKSEPFCHGPVERRYG